MKKKSYYKDMIVETLLEKHDMIDWEMSIDDEAQVVGYIKKYTIRIFHLRDGYFLQAFYNDDALLIHTITEKECPRIKELFKKVRDSIIDAEEGKFWEKICGLFNED